MKKRQNNSTRASALQITLSVALMAVSAILFASSFRAAPQAASDSFYPPLPNQHSQFSPPLPDGITPLPGVTVALPVDTVDAGLPASTVYIKPMNTTLIDSTTTGGANLVGFQGDFSFDQTVVTFATPQVQRAGLTSDPNWNVSANILPGGGPIRTLRISSFMGA